MNALPPSPAPEPGPLRPRALARYQRALFAMRRAALRAAAALSELDAAGHWRTEGFASLAEFGEHHGSSARETRTLLRLAQAIELRPEWHQEVRQGRISVESAAVLRDVALDPKLERPGEDFARLAREHSAAKLQRLVRRRQAEVREGGPVVELTIHLSGPSCEDLERARTVASRRAERVLTLSETVAAVARHYLVWHDAAYRRPGRRRMPSTRGRPGRAVPAEVDRALRKRHEGRCAVPGCDHSIWVDRAHLRAKRLGGDQESGNLILLCRRHHWMLDSGQIRLVGPPGQRRFCTRGGRDLGPLDEPRAPDPPEG